MSQSGVLAQDLVSPVTIPPQLLYPLLIVSAALCAIYVRQQSSRVFRMGHKMPGPPTLPFVGNAHEAFCCKNPNELLEKVLDISQGFGSVVRVFLGTKLIVFLTEPADIEIILSSHVHIKKSSEYRFFKPWLGEGLLISSGDRWRSHRKMIAPTFHMNILKSFMDVFNRNSKETVERMKKEIGNPFDVHDYLSGTTVDILLETAMGVTKKTYDSAGFEYAMAVMKMCDIIHQRHYKFWLRSDRIFNLTKYAGMQKKFLSIIHGLTSRVIKKRKDEYINSKKLGDSQSLFEKVTMEMEKKEEKERIQNSSVSAGVAKGLRDDLDENDENDVGEKKRLAFLDFMIEASQNSNSIDDHDIKEEVDTIMFEGHDTTAAGSSFVLCLLGAHPDVQERAMQELDAIFGDSDRAVTFADTTHMKYLERVILETLRMYPPVPAIAREVAEDVQLATDNHVIPSGSTVVIGTYKMHRRADLFPDPETFNPDNFLPERCQARHYYSFIPFSAGPRSCVGRKYAMLKLKVLLATILRSYKVISEVPEKDFKLQGDIILKRTDGFRIRIEPRTKTAMNL